jgi:hypothetical protein
MSEQAHERLRRLIRRSRVVELPTLYELLGTQSRMTVFRRLREIGYRSSFTHAGRYYTLADIPTFDEQGLWFYGDIGFSRVGTLKETTVVQVEQTPEGRTHAELRNLLRVRVHNTLLGLLREGRIGREPLGETYLYVSADPQRAAAQIGERLELRTLMAEVLRLPTEEEVVEVLVEALRAAPLIPAPDEVSRRLTARGVNLEPRHVEHVYEAHQLVAGKKTAHFNSQRSQP